MAIKVYKVAEIVGGKVVFKDNGKFRISDLAAITTNLEAIDDPLPTSAWSMEIIIGAGTYARSVEIDLLPFLPRSYQPDTPYFHPGAAGRLAFFKDRLFLAERPPANEEERNEVVLRVKKAAYEEQTELSSLRAAVANFEAALQFQKSGSKRDPIPEHVKRIVWARDGGACVRCGSKRDLHFDHIIPVAKGGGSSEANIQILCQSCNLAKSDKIAVT
jgi:hypothetical protein